MDTSGVGGPGVKIQDIFICDPVLVRSGQRVVLHLTPVKAVGQVFL